MNRCEIVLLFYKQQSGMSASNTSQNFHPARLQAAKLAKNPAVGFCYFIFQILFEFKTAPFYITVPAQWVNVE